MPRDGRLRTSAEFRAVYSGGRRFEGRLMTVFLLSNALGRQRFGITASRKMSRKAVDRNRAKRLLREAFRLSEAELKTLRGGYDWVFNARRAILEVKLGAVLEELRRVVERAARDEPEPTGGVEK